MRLELATGRFYLGRDYSEALAANGCTPVHIPLIPDREYIDSVMASLDGLLLPGSDSDVDPFLFGAEPHPKIGSIVPEKDATDRLALDAAERLEMPILAICFGMQALNVHRGGTLIQDILSAKPDAVKHEQGVPRDRNSHSIAIEKGILDSLAGDGFDGRVNSHHHQAIDKVGRDLRATAWARDGMIECVEDDREGRAVLGVQWHPEISWKTDKLSAAIFGWFADACRGRMAPREAAIGK